MTTVGEPVTERGGSPSVEAAIVTVVMGLLIVFAIAGGRLVTAEASVDHAASAAARVASLERTAAAAKAAADRAARAGLGARGLHCISTQVIVDVSGLSAPIGDPASVRATVRCTVSWADLGLPGAPGSMAVESTWTSPVDRWRERP